MSRVRRRFNWRSCVALRLFQMPQNFCTIVKTTCHPSKANLKYRLLFLIIISVLFILYSIKFQTLLFEDDKKTLVIPNLYTQLNESVKVLIPILQSETGRPLLEIKKLMIAQVPELHYNQIQAHTLNGKNWSISQVQQLIKDDKIVPSAAHFVLPFFKPTLQFHHLVCILSAYWIFKPKRLMLWYNDWPSGEYWDYLMQNISDVENKVIFVHRPVPTRLYTVSINTKEHQSDVVRMEALLIFGGAYFDLDVVILKNMDHLRNYPFTIGRENDVGLCNGVMLSEPNNTFLRLWHLGYQVMQDDQWAIHSVRLPHRMQKIWSAYVHVEEDSMNRPNWMEVSLIYGEKRVWPWKEKNYCMHLWYRFHNVQYNFTSIKHVNSTFGDMFQYVLFGSNVTKNST